MEDVDERTALCACVRARDALHQYCFFLSTGTGCSESFFGYSDHWALHHQHTHTRVHNTCTHTRTPPHTQGWAITLYENNQQQDVVMKLSYGFHPEADYFPIVAQPELLFLSYDIIKQKFLLLQNHFLHSKKMS